MPVQINEVVIRTTVSSTPSDTAGSSTEICNTNSAEGAGGGGAGSIEEIVERVLEILKTKQER